MEGVAGTDETGLRVAGEATGDDAVDEESKRFVREGPPTDSDDFAIPLVMSRIGEGVGFGATGAGAIVFLESTFAWSVTVGCPALVSTTSLSFDQHSLRVA
jgi:hypothetical protein